MNVEDARKMFESRKGFFNGSVYIDVGHYPIHKGCCVQCGNTLQDYDRNFTDELNKDFVLCYKCFELYSVFTPVIVHHCPGCVEDGGDKRFLNWNGTKDFIQKNPPSNGWHYEFSTSEYYDWKKRIFRKQGHIMDVKDDRSEWWVLWVVNDDKIVEDVKLPKFRAKHN